ncbi:thiol reductant ABC exporter subunit CydC [Acidisoma cellulosilytica]|uniref:Thiol reductant ABC exporter subunit CydC n=1 Tax=Acidisoma cellulosilyticum TaxID=2802395 RepID=A0A963Z2Z8_9PROT|nr:thiol reductant ABC exporter subunit CydC [Acidisoma cellulosilyticum]MCB8881544.1 thiol reductant ABC exporter subunit CydC [Acidisoma cellulosilyticum]
MKDLWRLLRLLSASWHWQVLGILLGIVVVLTNVGLLALSGWFIAAMGLAGLGLLHLEYFLPAAAIRALAIIRTVGRYLERLTTHEATFRLLSQLRVWFYQHLEPLAPARLQTHRAGDLLSRIRADIDSLDNFYLRVLAPSIVAPVCAVLMVLFLAHFSAGAALADLLGLLLVGLALPLMAFRLARRPGQAAVTQRGQLRAEIADTIRGFEELRVFGALARQTAQHEAGYEALIGAERAQARVEAASGGAGLFIVQCTMLAALVCAIPLASAGRLPGPDIAMIALFVLASFDAVSGLPNAYRALGETLAAARRIFEIVDAEPAVKEPSAEAPAPLRFDIAFRDVGLRYDAHAPWALDGVSLTIPAGGSLGIVGPTGSGKTSLGNLLLRFWDCERGEVLIGGVPIRDLNGETVRGFCAVIAQQTHLFNTSIRENLRLARPDATDAAMHDALRRAGILDEVSAMPDGLETMVGEVGTQLSGGQARRIAIARAFLKDAPILVLDEPTEGLDALSERIVIDALALLMQGRTTLMITHRPQALRDVDSVARMEQGQIFPV